MTVRTRTWPALLVLLGAGAVQVQAQAPLRVDITEGTASRLPLAIAELPSGPVAGVTSAGDDLGLALSRIMRADLSGTGLYRLVSADTTVSPDGGVSFGPFQRAGAQNLAVGRIRGMTGGLLDYECAFYEVFGGRLAFSRTIQVLPAQWRRAAHKCADMVFEETTGDPGHFDTRLLYVAETGPKTGRMTHIAAMDYDGAGLTDITPAGQLVAMPHFSPDGRRIVYMAYDRDQPRLMVMDLETGHAAALDLPPGIPFAPRFSPDGRSLAFSLGREGETDIYRFDFATAATVRLTDSPGSSTSPDWSPDGNRIVFESSRSGRQQIYTMTADGSRQHRISFGDAAYGAPAWNPRGGIIAFTRIGTDGMRIGVMNEDGSHVRMLSDGPGDEGPSWAPSGRALLFGRTVPGDAPSQLWMMNADGTMQRRVGVSSGGSDPDWSERRP
jgi:TolB protein